MFEVKKRAHLAVLVGCILYGMTGLFLSRIYNMSIASIIFYRLFFGLCLISIFLLITGRLGELNPGKHRTQLFLQGVVVLANMFFYFICVQKTCFSVGILLEYTAPIYVMLASPFLLNEKVGKTSIAALFLAMVGVYLVISPKGGFGTFEYSSDYFIGIIAGLFAGGIYAVVIMNVRILKKDHSEFAIAFWGTAISCLLMTPFAFETSLSVLTANIIPLLTFGVISVGIGGILTTIGFANLKSQTGSLLALIEPVAGVFFDLTVLGVTLQTGTIAGCILILVAAVIATYNEFTKPSEKYKGGLNLSKL